MFERELFGSFRQRGVRLLLATALVVPAPAIAQIAGYPIDPSEQGRTRTSQSTNDPRATVSTRAATNAAEAQAYVPGSSYEPDEIEDSRARVDSARRVLSEEELLTDRDRQYVTRPARRPTPPSEFETLVSKVVDKPLRRFGANLLVPDARDFTAPPTTTVPLDYRLNPGDELLIGLTGSVQASDLRLTVNSDGRIFIPRVGAVNVAGVRYGDLQGLIARQVSRQYRNFRVAVSIARLRGITVYVTGFAEQPGSYTVSSLSTLVNAVLAAGGPSAGGSFRSIQVRRDGQLISDFDLYDLLLKGDKSADVLLQNGDVIFIAPAGAQVAVVGSVNVEAIYEASAGETIHDVLLNAGGVNTVADDSSRLLILDPTKTGGWQDSTPGQVQARVATRRDRPRTCPPSASPSRSEPARAGDGERRSGTAGPLLCSARHAVERQSWRGRRPDHRAYPYGAVLTRESVRADPAPAMSGRSGIIELLLTAQPWSSVSRQPAAPTDPTFGRPVGRGPARGPPTGWTAGDRMAPADRLPPGRH